MAKYTANQIADTLIAIAREEKIPISNLKLQKLMYYAQGWALAHTSKPLFDDEEFEAWVHGPVIPSQFRRFKEHRWNPIETDVKPVDDDGLRKYLAKIVKGYGKYGAFQLEELTHSESPWIDARGDTAPKDPSHNVISRESMKLFFTKKLANEKQGKPSVQKA